MPSTSLVPLEFFNYGILFELSFAVVTLIVSLYAFRIYKIFKQRQSKLFGIAFLFISIHYFIQSFLNILIVTKLNQNICSLMKAQDVATLNLYGVYSHMFFFMMGLITLTYMTLKVKGKTIYSLIFILSLLPVVFSTNKLFVFYAVSSVLLIYISLFYFKNYSKNKQIKTLLVFVAFLFLLFGNIHFIFSVNHATYYIVGHFLELIAYALILINLFLVLKK